MRIVRLQGVRGGQEPSWDRGLAPCGIGKRSDDLLRPERTLRKERDNDGDDLRKHLLNVYGVLLVRSKSPQCAGSGHGGAHVSTSHGGTGQRDVVPVAMERASPTDAG